MWKRRKKRSSRRDIPFSPTARPQQPSPASPQEKQDSIAPDASQPTEITAEPTDPGASNDASNPSPAPHSDAGEKRRRRKRSTRGMQVNTKLLIRLGICVLAIAGGMHLLHIRQTTDLINEELSYGRRLQAQGETAKAVKHLTNYLRMVPDDLKTRVELMTLLDEFERRSTTPTLGIAPFSTARRSCGSPPSGTTYVVERRNYVSVWAFRNRLSSTSSRS